MIAARAAEAGDEPEVRRLATLARAALDDAKGGPQLLADLPSPDAVAASLGDVLLGTIGDVPFGYCVVRADGDRGRLSELYVEPTGRGVGVGAALLAAAIDRVGAAGCTGIDSQVLPGDRATKNFFEAHGMVARLIVTHRSLTEPVRP